VISGGVAGLFDPKSDGRERRLGVPGSDSPDREGIVRSLMAILPGEAFAGITGMLAATDSQAWEQTAARMPELDSPI